MVPKQEPTAEHPAIIILNAVAVHERQVGVGSLALVLKGSKSKRVFDRKLYESPVFGALFYHPVDVIENFIKQLFEQKYLTIVDIGDRYVIPVLELSAVGKEVLQQKNDIPLQTIHSPPMLNESGQITVQAFQKLQSVSKVAELRGLAQSTVWDHLIIAVKLGLLVSADIVEPEKARLILETNARLKQKGLKELKAALPENINYDEIRCVQAQERRF